MKLIRKNKKGFTLVELIVVIAILAILALILVPAITGYVSKANKSKNQANARAVYTTAMLVNADATTPYADGDALETAVLAFDSTLDGTKFTITLDSSSTEKQHQKKRVRSYLVLIK
ncbi:MAG: prepilin-type N-terminal cleavage/methylation domain-containing protein, partial [Erysipelothrix sp.]|nr:prepilin-type N-terminal cleavage/methylation domain-containing protein [Erysipelothrix sp.]